MIDGAPSQRAVLTVVCTILFAWCGCSVFGIDLEKRSPYCFVEMQTPVFAISDTVWLALIAAASPAVLAALGMWLKFRLDAINKKACDIEKTAIKTEKLVNSQSLAQDRVVAELARWKADQPPKNPAYEEAAIEAERVYREHRKLQDEMEKKNGVELGLEHPPQTLGMW